MIRAADLWEKTGPPPGTAGSLSLLAPAKINLFLEIKGRRPDGYHNLATLFQEISLADELSVSYDPGASGTDFRCDSRELRLAKGANLVERAVALLRQAFGVRGRFSIRLKKRVPAGAGLGGGSSDGAAALMAGAWLAGLWVRKGAGARKELVDLAARLGADVPFFLKGGTCLGTGLGERLRPLKGPRAWFVLVFPGFPVATAGVYKALRLPLTVHGSIRKIMQEFRRGFHSGRWARLLYNRLEEVVLPRYPEIKAVKNELLSLRCEGALMSGSGSSVFGVVSSRREGERVLGRLRGRGWKAWLATSELREPCA